MDYGWLWFAFILLSLSYWKQHLLEYILHIVCCDLLSFYYLCRTGNNKTCLQRKSDALWFAFILLSLSYWKQRFAKLPASTSGCDLLSFYYLCRTGNNRVQNTGLSHMLWFAFILLSLSYWKQLNVTSPICFARCDLLSFYYLCRTGNNRIDFSPALLPLWFAFILLSLSYWKQLSPSFRPSVAVVICFHFTIFVVLETTKRYLPEYMFRLWFAFILLSLSYWKQLARCGNGNTARCDLLSFYYLCRTGNNGGRPRHRIHPVVICFHFTIFVVLETTRRTAACRPASCDLLSFYYLCRTGNNYSVAVAFRVEVVICFHFTIFVVLETTQSEESPNPTLLWFAFILLSLSYWKQPGEERQADGSGCDLLSFYYLCRTGNNRSTRTPPRAWLWFAFILLSLSYWKQRMIDGMREAYSCDLLSFYYLCRTGNNFAIAEREALLVVICFHFTIFVVLETTKTRRYNMENLLWFAFILLSLSYWKQLEELRVSIRGRCDLLSFYYLCRTGNNKYRRYKGIYKLWFAFILLSLSYWKQLIETIKEQIECCDLLSFYYLCRTGNNRIYIIYCISARYRDNRNTKNVVSDRM